MAEISNCVEMLLENEAELLQGAVDTLLRIAGNILRDPSNEKYRSVNLSNSVVEKKLLPAIGALEVLFLMGFEEGEDRLVLPKDDPLDNIRRYQKELLTLKQTRLSKPTVKGSPVKPVVALTQEVQKMEADFRSQLAREFERVLVYESPALQEKARQVLPTQKLHDSARKNLAILNSSVNKDEKPLDFQDCVLLELLKWFKNDFFKWFNSPSCPQCQNAMKASGSEEPTQEDLKWGGNRVESYSCSSCGTRDRFVRYNDPGKLLETRQGRCGEWANCFTLLCRTLGMDARWVHDHTDHVWTEVYSQSQGRWLHADSCENKMDTPLMYESGWSKKLSYIIAFSKDEVVDVTWRYTNKQSEVMKNRRRCREPWLVSTIMEINKQRQSAFPEAKRNFLEHRLLAEVAEFFSAKKATKESENEGRSSGSLAWRLARGESQAVGSQNKVFTLTAQELEKKEFMLKYSPARDEYIRVSSDGEMLKGLQAGVKEAKDVFRKHESDWKMVYIARSEGTEAGELSWEVDWSQAGLTPVSVLVVFQHATYENGSVSWQVCLGDKCFMGNKDGVLDIKGESVGGSPTKLELSARLSKGQGECAWQHAQLFRQPDFAKDQYPFLLHIRFK